jgi:hypothetical protein
MLFAKQGMSFGDARMRKVAEMKRERLVRLAVDGPTFLSGEWRGRRHAKPFLQRTLSTTWLKCAHHCTDTIKQEVPGRINDASRF